MKKTNKVIVTILFFIVVIGIVMMSYNYIISKINLTFETINLEMYGNSTPKKIDSNDNGETAELTNKTVNYIGYVEIPKITLKQGFVSMESSENNVDQNIQIITPSSYPDVPNGNFILAAHSGNSPISYFKKLYKLNTNDYVNIIYKNNKYKYKIVNIYTVPKNGEIAIYRDQNKTTITLITCTKDDDETQTIYIGELKETITV